MSIWYNFKNYVQNAKLSALVHEVEWKFPSSLPNVYTAQPTGDVALRPLPRRGISVNRSKLRSTGHLWYRPHGTPRGNESPFRVVYERPIRQFYSTVLVYGTTRLTRPVWSEPSSLPNLVLTFQNHPCRIKFNI